LSVGPAGHQSPSPLTLSLHHLGIASQKTLGAFVSQMLRLLSPTPAPSNGPRIAAFEIHTRARTPAYSEYVLTPWFYPLKPPRR